MRFAALIGWVCRPALGDAWPAASSGNDTTFLEFVSLTTMPLFTGKPEALPMSMRGRTPQTIILHHAGDALVPVS